MSTLNFGDRAAQIVSARIASPVANVTELKSISRRSPGQICHVADGSRWQFNLASSLTGDDVLVATPASGNGRWLRMPGDVCLSLPIGFATADAAVLLTVPAGCVLKPLEFFWSVTADFTGGSSSAIGVSSGTKAGATTKGDFLGGAAGNVAAALTAALSPNMGTIGVGFDTIAERRIFLLPTDTIRFDRITSAFTAGAGAVNVVAHIVQNNGA